MTKRILIILLVCFTTTFAQAQSTQDKLNNLHHNSVECMMFFTLVHIRTKDDPATSAKALKAVYAMAGVVHALSFDERVTEARRQMWLSQWNSFKQPNGQFVDGWFSVVMNKYDAFCVNHINTLSQQLDSIR